jgi:hypothetical protein
MTLVPVCRPIDDTAHDVVPAAEPLPPLLFDQLTDVTPTLSDDAPPSDIFEPVATYDALAVGVAIEMSGNVVSGVGAAVTVHENVWGVDCSTPSDTPAVTEYVPAVDGVPETNPVAEPTKSPGGSPVAV